MDDLRVDREVGGRYDDRLATLPGGRWASATDLSLTWWSADGPGDWVRSEEALPGPLVWLPAVEELAWGPTVVRDGRPAWHVGPMVRAAVGDLGDNAARRFVPTAGAVSPEARFVAVALRRQLPRTVPSRTPAVPGPESRVAVVDQKSEERVAVVHEGGTAPTALAWGVGALFVGLVGTVLEVGQDTFEPVERALPRMSACRCLAVTRDGRVAAGLADGHAVVWFGPVEPTTWPAHDGVITAAAWRPGGGGLATGGADGMVRLWSHTGACMAEAGFGTAIDALAWADEGRLVAKAGGQGGAVLVLSADS